MSMRDGQNEIRPGVLYAVAATATVITAVLLRFQQFSVYPGLNGDEADLASRAQDVITLGEGWLTVSGFFAPYALALSALSTPWFDDPLLGVRLPFAIVELLGVPVAWVLFRMTTDRTTALYAALLLLTMPVFMVMSRIAWEPSFVPVASVLVFSAVLARRFVLASALLLLAMLAHPIIVFIAPIVFLAWAGEIWRHGRIRSRETLVMIVLGVLVAAAALGAFLLSTTAQTITASGIEEPVLSVGNIVGFLKSIGEFASGVRAYESVAGRPPLASVLLHDAVALMVVLLAGLGLLWRLPEQ
ncbi:MAG: glycosyltransferase family 39 protein, partial [Pseudomonadota bacterium]